MMALHWGEGERVRPIKILLFAAVLAAVAIPANADPGPDEILDSLQGTETLAECTVTGVGSCIATWEMFGPVSFYFHMDFHNLVGVGSYLVEWYDSFGLVESWECPWVAIQGIVPGCIQSDHGDSATAIYTAVSSTSYAGGTQQLIVTVTEANCGMGDCVFHAAYRRFPT